MLISNKILYSGYKRGIKIPEMKPLDKILELIHDSNWHSLDEIGSRVPLSEDKFEKVIAFLEENEFISLDDDNKSAKIKTLGLRFLELPKGY